MIRLDEQATLANANASVSSVYRTGEKLSYQLFSRVLYLSTIRCNFTIFHYKFVLRKDQVFVRYRWYFHIDEIVLKYRNA